MSTAISTEVGDEPITPTSTLAMIARAASDPKVDVAKMQALMSMHERVMDRENRNSFVRAFTDLQAVLPRITKRGAILNSAGQTQSRYAKWEDIHRVIHPLLDEHGFTLNFRIGEDAQGRVTVNAVLRHQEGHEEESGFMPIPLDASGGKNNVQGIGSSVAYGKRYTTIALLNIVTEEDTDGRPQENVDPTPQQNLMIEEAMQVAKGGVEAYAEYFKALPRPTKLWLVNSGNHDKIKKVAAGDGK